MSYRCNCGNEFPEALARTAHSATCLTMTRDLFKDGFTAEDFMLDPCNGKAAADRANAILKAEVATFIREFEADHDCVCCNNNRAQIEAMQRLVVRVEGIK